MVARRADPSRRPGSLPERRKNKSLYACFSSEKEGTFVLF
jgi:hypothetical protein